MHPCFAVALQGGPPPSFTQRAVFNPESREIFVFSVRAIYLIVLCPLFSRALRNQLYLPFSHCQFLKMLHCSFLLLLLPFLLPQGLTKENKAYAWNEAQPPAIHNTLWAFQVDSNTWFVREGKEGNELVKN